MTPKLTNNTLTSTDSNQDDVTIPTWDGEAPVNYRHIRESVALSMFAEGIDGETIATVLKTVDQALVNNEQFLLWENDVPNELTPPSPDAYDVQAGPAQTSLDSDRTAQ